MPQLTTFRLYLLGIALLFGGYVALEYNRPKPLNWSPTYANKDKIPYGTYVLYDQLPRLLGTDSVEVVRLPVYNQLTGLGPTEIPEHWAKPTVEDVTTSTADSTADGAAADSASVASTATVATESRDEAEEVASEEGADNENPTAIPLLRQQANYLFINNDFELSRPDALALLRFAARGNDVFVAAQSFGSGRGLLRDSLGFSVKDVEIKTHQGPGGLPQLDSVDLRFTNPALAAVRTRLPGIGARQRLLVDSGRVGRTLATDAQGRATFVRLDYGRGHFYVCTTPVAFPYYYLLRPRTAGFAAAALAYLPARR